MLLVFVFSAGTIFYFESFSCSDLGRPGKLLLTKPCVGPDGESIDLVKVYNLTPNGGLSLVRLSKGKSPYLVEIKVGEILYLIWPEAIG